MSAPAQVTKRPPFGVAFAAQSGTGERDREIGHAIRRLER
jgi:hypothetical protein